MDNNYGFVALHRKILDWEWYSDIPARIMFVHMLLKANHSDKKWRGKVIKKGSFITSIQTLSSETGLSYQQTRSTIKKLESTKEITNKTTNKYTTIIIHNYAHFQDESTKVSASFNNQITNKQQTNNKQITTTNNSSSCTYVTSTVSKKNSISKEIHVDEIADDDVLKNKKSKDPKKKKTDLVIDGVGSIDTAFESLWAFYPMKDGRKSAIKSFRSSVKTNDDYADICEALKKYLAYVQNIRTSGINRAWKNGSTWFANWKDWVNFELPVDGPKKTIKLDYKTQNYMDSAEQFMSMGDPDPQKDVTLEEVFG